MVAKQQLEFEANPAPGIISHLASLLEVFRPVLQEDRRQLEEGTQLANAVFAKLTSRKFCYLSRKRSEKYRPDVISALARRIMKGEPFQFFYDIGPGYHATTRPGILPLNFEIGLSELYILSQVRLLCDEIEKIYPPGSKFWLVIDNVCALRTNDVPISSTERYVSQLRDLISETEMGTRAELIVESEIIGVDEYDRKLEATEPTVSSLDVDHRTVGNVARFLGRKCTVEEAVKRVELYSRTSAVTDSIFSHLVNDVHMTQRATGATLGFRPFPGGDQRAQAGQVALMHGSKNKLLPFLLTSRNIEKYVCSEYSFPELMPKSVSKITYAQPSP